MTNDQLAALLRKIAHQVAAQDTGSLELLEAVSRAEKELLDRKHPDGFRLLDRISFLLTAPGASSQYGDFIQQQTLKLKPLDSAKDSAALIELAKSFEDN